MINISEYLAQKVREKSRGEQSYIRFVPRPYQLQVEKDFEEMVNAQVLYICWARRLGKDQWAFKYSGEYCIKHPNSRVYYLFPLIKQGRKAIFEGVTTEGQRWIESILDPTVLKRPKTGELYFSDNTIRFKNGSIISLVGDDGDALVGSNIDILVVSEAALIKRSTLDYLVPSVIKNKGKIICISTPRYGSYFNEILLDPNSIGLKSIIRADEAYDNDGSRIYTDEELELARKLMSKEKFQSDYMVDLSSHNETSIYGRSLEEATFIGISDISNKSIFISADLGSTDNSSYVFAIFDDNKIKVIHHYRNRGVATQHYIDYVKKWCRDNNIDIKKVTIILPQDGKNVIDAARYLTSRVEFWRESGFNVVTLNHVGVLRGIEITRTAIETGDLQFVNTNAVRNLMNIIKAYEWKTTPQGEIIYVPKHGSGYAASNDADSLEYMCITFLLDKYEKTYRTESGVIIKGGSY